MAAKKVVQLEQTRVDQKAAWMVGPTVDWLVENSVEMKGGQ